MKELKDRFDNFFIPIKPGINLSEEPFVAPKLLHWFLYGDIGLSSETMVNVAVGKEYENYYPCDPSDFNRCLKLVKEIPEIKNYFDKISKISPQWKTVIDNWDKLEETFLSEVGYRPSKTYQLMKDLGL